MEFIGKGGEFVKDVKDNKNGLRVKMLLTKEELQWLMMHLRNREENGKRIEDVLEEIENGRKKAGHVWRPSLDSITEIPELLEMDR
ncbi:50S ribosomal protein L22 [Bienertia sinuspersici]